MTIALLVENLYGMLFNTALDSGCTVESIFGQIGMNFEPHVSMLVVSCKCKHDVSGCYYFLL